MLLFSLFLACASEPGDLGLSEELEAEDALRFAPYDAHGEVVESVDPARYVGLWYEIATTGSLQQQQCAGTNATYTPLDEDTIEVLNRCYVGSIEGPLSEIVGTATALDESFARLLVDFNFGFEAPYDIVELDGTDSDEPYQFAAVSSLNGAQLWILGRTPRMDDAVYDALFTRLDVRGMDPSRLVLTDQGTTDF